MNSDTIFVLDLKVNAFRALVESKTFDGLQSHRQANIQLHKLERMKAKFDAQYPPLVLVLSGKKVDKIRGQHMHQLNQQSKAVDRLCIKLFEEHVNRHLSDAPPFAVPVSMLVLG